jgi:prepilin-type N-terminal cleavage/methylation domain-containing protein
MHAVARSVRSVRWGGADSRVLYGMTLAERPAILDVDHLPVLSSGEPMHESCLQDDSGFTVIELMTVVLIIGILVTMAVASYLVATNRAQRITCLANQRIFSSAIVTYEAQHKGALPDALQTLVDEGYVKRPHVDECPADNSVHYLYDNSTGELSCPLHPFTP